MIFTTKLLLISLVFILSACSSAHILVDTPNLYVSSQAYPSRDIAEGYETTTPELFFVTDRQIEGIDNVTHLYGSARSSSIAFGTVKIQFGQGLSWDALEAASNTQSRDNDIILSVADINEILRFPEIPLPFRVENGKAIIMPESSAAYETAIRSMQGHLQVLQWARANDCPWNVTTCSQAAGGGHLSVLLWARRNGCPWDRATCLRIAKHINSLVGKSPLMHRGWLHERGEEGGNY